MIKEIVGIAVDIKSSAVRLKICVTAGIKKKKSIIKKKKKSMINYDC